MQYRPFGKTCDFEVSALGFGCMRLPILDGDTSKIDEPLATELLRLAIDAGVDYVDTAYPYHDGNSERWLSRALADGYREKVRIADKMPTWAVKTPEDLDRLFDEQLERLQVEHIDVYLLHNLHEGVWPTLLEVNALEWLDAKKAEGRIGVAGFSFHGSYSLFEEIVPAYDWQMCQIQYNYMNENVQAGTKGLELAASKGLAVSIMEPLLGGSLANPPDELVAAWDAVPGTSPADTALQWLWNKPEVSVVLSGMNARSQVEENLASADRSGVGGLKPELQELVEKARNHYRQLDTIPCTRCAYCMPCPKGVDIPRCFQLYNDSVVFGGNQLRLNRILYSNAPDAAGTNCVACGACEKKCPQSIKISEELEKVDAFFKA